MRAIVSRKEFFGRPTGVAEFEMGAAFRNVAHHAIPGRATFGNLGGPAVNHLVAWAVASVRHRKAPNLKPDLLREPGAHKRAAHAKMQR